MGKVIDYFSRVLLPPQKEEVYEYMPQNTYFDGQRKTKEKQDGYISKIRKHVKLDECSLYRMSPAKALEVLRHNHPDVSQAVWNYKTIGNSGYKVKVTMLDGVTEHKSGQKLVDDFIRSLDYYSTGRFEKSRSLDKLIDELFETALLTGAVAIEEVMDNEAEDVLYLAPVDPNTIYFEREYGRVVPYQRPDIGGEIRLDIPTFFYEGLDETVNDPYGTSPFLSVIQIVTFHLQVLNDLKQVVHNQGYGKYDIKVIEEVLLKRMPVSIRNNEKKKTEWLNEQLANIIDMYSKLDPDAAFVHMDSVEVGMVDSAKAMVDPEKIMNVIDALMNNALKQYSTLMGRRSTGQTEQYAKLEIKIFMKSVKRIQRLIESVLSRALTKLLNIHGMQGYVSFKMNDTEVRTDLEKVNFEQIVIANAQKKRDNGWITQDDAAEEVTGHKATGQMDRAALGINDEPAGALDERQPSDPTSSDSTSE